MAVITLPFRPSAPGCPDVLFQCPPAESIQAIAPTALVSPFLTFDNLTPQLIQQPLKRAVD